MAKGTYIGGHTIIGPSDDPYRLENTAPEKFEPDEDRQRYIPEYQCDGSLESWKVFGYWLCLDVLLAAQHAAIHGDLTTFTKVANEQFDTQEQSELLRLANVLMTGREFFKEKGEVKCRKTGKLGWNWSALAALAQAVQSTAGEEFEEPPEIDERLVSMLKAEGCWPL